MAMLQHLPKISVAAAVVMGLCFFLPWLSIDSGEMSLVQLSGFQLIMGSLPLNDPHVQELRENYRYNEELAMALPKAEQGHKRWYDAASFAGVAGIIVVALSSFTNLTRGKALALAVCSGFGFVSMLGVSLFDFGWKLPAEADASMQFSNEIGVYVIEGCCLALSGLGIFAMTQIKEIHIQPAEGEQAKRKYMPLDLNMDLSVEPQDQSNNVDMSLGINEPIKPVAAEPQQKLPAGTLTCPSCGSVVGKYQTKCMKCGSALKK